MGVLCLLVRLKRDIMPSQPTCLQVVDYFTHGNRSRATHYADKWAEEIASLAKSETFKTSRVPRPMQYMRSGIPDHAIPVLQPDP